MSIGGMFTGISLVELSGNPKHIAQQTEFIRKMECLGKSLRLLTVRVCSLSANKIILSRPTEYPEHRRTAALKINQRLRDPSLSTGSTVGI
jgi:hypothetical protein